MGDFRLKNKLAAKAISPEEAEPFHLAQCAQLLQGDLQRLVRAFGIWTRDADDLKNDQVFHFYLEQIKEEYLECGYFPDDDWDWHFEIQGPDVLFTSCPHAGKVSSTKLEIRIPLPLLH